MSDLEEKGLQYPIMRQKYEGRIEVLEAENIELRRCLKTFGEYLQDCPIPEDWKRHRTRLLDRAEALLKQGETR